MTLITASPADRDVTIVEVGPRDGLQRESRRLSTDQKLALIAGLADAGLRWIQVTSFVHPRLVPQMADAETLCAHLPSSPGVVYSGLALNLKGIERAAQAGLSHVDISVSASDAHSRRNANRSRAEAMAEFKDMVALARAHGLTVRAGVQCAFGYERPDDVEPAGVVDIVERHLALSIDELALADSAGLADPRQLAAMLDAILPLLDETPCVLHLHDTRGLGLANVLAALERGVRRFDTAFGGLGGCPFIDGAAGNIATEDTVHLLERLGFTTGIDLARVASVSRQAEKLLHHDLPGKLYRLAGAARPA